MIKLERERLPKPSLASSINGTRPVGRTEGSYAITIDVTITNPGLLNSSITYVTIICRLSLEEAFRQVISSVYIEDAIFIKGAIA